MQSSFSGDSIGVGLHLSHELVNVHKGNISYREREGGGSVFTVILPADKDIYESKDFLIADNILIKEANEQTICSSEANDKPHEAFVPPVPPLNKRKILIIEDDNEIRTFLQEEISPYFNVETAPDGLSGFEKAQTCEADLIICDVFMPGMTGFELTKKLKADFATSHIPIILLTAFNSPEKHLEGIESGADAYIAKPFSIKLLLARVFGLIEQRDKMREKFSSEPGLTRAVLYTTDRDKEFAERLAIVLEQHLSRPEFSIVIVCVFLFVSCSFMSFVIFGGYSARVPPLPIPNREVKPPRADGTASQWESRSPPFFSLDFPCLFPFKGE